MENRPTIEFPPPVIITPVKSAELHQFWPFIERGLRDIRRKVRPDWLEVDLYSALRADLATACIVSRGTRWLGFIVWHRQERVWSHKLDIFVWACWALPLRERQPGDNIEEAIQRGREYLYGVKSAIGANSVIMITSYQRKGWIRKYGLRPIFMTCEA